jgi:hypothetical protein
VRQDTLDREKAKEKGKINGTLESTAGSCGDSADFVLDFHVARCRSSWIC